MKEMLEELLSDYQKKYNAIRDECIELMKACRSGEWRIIFRETCLPDLQ
jgi:hypothetical protein